MFERLAAEVRDLNVPVDGTAIVELVAIQDQLAARVAGAVGEFDAAELWDVDAATSMHAWLRDRARMTGAQAGRLVGVARRTRTWLATRQAWAAGELSSGQVDAIVSNVGRHGELFAEHEAEVVPNLAPLSVNDTVTVMGEWRRRADALDEPAEPAEPPSRLHHNRLLDGRGALDGEFDAEDNAIIETALRVGASRDGDGEPARTPAERRADSLVDVCRFFLDNQTARPGGRHRPHLNIVVNIEGFDGHIVNGPALSREVLERYFCDSALHRLLMQGRSAVLDLGISTRVLTAALWTALVARDEHCRFPGCDRPATWCDAHHIIWFSRHGPTRLDNLVLLCRRHHKRLHQPGWHAKLLPDATLEVTTPDGIVRTSRPPGALDPLW